ncbi:MAG: GerAB/ArcD/ProY family transporter [Eubacteriales bacterium]|nr:GerAB/ArcD/ProY family transporter [Eubacteriales bacterium]
MKFAENNRISHRQFYRQMVLAFLAPFLLCLFGRDRILGPAGIAGTVAGMILLLFYVIFLIRLEPYYSDLNKSAGGFWSRIFGGFFVIYVLLTAAYLLEVLERIVPMSLLTGVSGRVISFCAVLVCAFGTHKGMQRRGRMAEVSGGLLLGGIVLMMLLCLGQSRISYLEEMSGAWNFSGEDFVKSTYGILCAFSGIGLIPFVLGNVQKQGSAWKPAALGILTLSGVILGMLFLFPAVFGWKRLQMEKFPVLPLLAGADLPGNVLARFDVLWMGFLLYSLLFAIGSLFHYGHQIIRLSHLGTGRYWMAVIVYLLSILEFDGIGIEDYYGVYLGYFFVPGLLILQIFLMLRGKGRRKKKAAAAAALSVMLFLSGCAGVEPEKRMYPLALGADTTDEGFVLTYGMPDLPQATGQDKQEEEGSVSALTITGADFGQIEASYNRSQEKYLDMGHLQVLILGNRIAGDGNWTVLLDYLEQEPFVGENVYVFRTENPKEILEWKNGKGTSIGEYLTGLMENRMSGQQKQGVTLREVYHQRYHSGEMPQLPEIRINGTEIEVYL